MQHKYQHNKELTEFSRDNRKKQTEAERFLWRHIRGRQLSGLKFRRQFPIGIYILDFYCPEKKVAIELDGSQHIQNKEYDEKRSFILQKYGIEMLRFWDNEVFQDIEGVKISILNKAGLL